MYSRSEYIDKFFASYPELSELDQSDGAWLCVQIIAIDSARDQVDVDFIGERSWLKLNPSHGFRASDVLRPGDWIAVPERRIGPLLGKKRQVEKTEGPIVWELLSPNLLDDDLDAAQSALSLGARPASLARHVQWSQFLRQVRSFFESRNFLEATTPTAVVSPGTEVHLDPVAVSLEFDFQKRTHFLITSPEYTLKKWVALGASRVFEIARCFRDKEAGQSHAVEFLMLEWYRAPGQLSDVMDDVQDLIHATQDLNQAPIQMVRTTVRELFQLHLKMDLSASADLKDYRSMCQACGIHSSESDTIDDLFHRLWLSRVEPALPSMFDDRPVCVSDFPPFQSALARLGKAGWTQRFEVYWRGFEICNAYQELNDPAENLRRMERDLKLRAELGKPLFPIDQQLIHALRRGLPPSSGIALGLERLYMALKQQTDISQVWRSPI